MGKLQIGDSLILLLSLLLLADDQGVLFLLLAAAALHEAGHYLVLRLADGELKRVTLTAAGAVMRYRMGDGRLRRFAVSAAGPATSLLCGWLAAVCGQFAFAGANFAFGLFNLLPVLPLDGGMMLFWALSGARGVRLFSGVCAAAMLPLGLWWNARGGGIWLLAVGMGLIFQQRTCIGTKSGIY